MSDSPRDVHAQKSDFLPGASFHFLTPLYELLARPMLGGVWRDVVCDVDKVASSGAAVVDLGCGPATVLRQLGIRRPDLSLTGVDVDEAMLASARQHLPRATFVKGSIDAVPIDAKSVDVVISSMVFHHLRHELKRPALQEGQRILKPGGIFLLCDFSVPVNKWGTWLVRWFGKLETGVASQGAGELLEIAAMASMSMAPRWTRLGCITQHEIQAAR
jgi:ubiquinone/menaquinone biosynthesis C-methylase UbiE